MNTSKVCGNCNYCYEGETDPQTLQKALVCYGVPPTVSAIAVPQGHQLGIMSVSNRPTVAAEMPGCRFWEFQATPAADA